MSISDSYAIRTLIKSLESKINSQNDILNLQMQKIDFLIQENVKLQKFLTENFENKPRKAPQKKPNLGAISLEGMSTEEVSKYAEHLKAIQSIEELKNERREKKEKQQLQSSEVATTLDTVLKMGITPEQMEAFIKFSAIK